MYLVYWKVQNKFGSQAGLRTQQPIKWHVLLLSCARKMIHLTRCHSTPFFFMWATTRWFSFSSQYFTFLRNRKLLQVLKLKNINKKRFLDHVLQSRIMWKVLKTRTQKRKRDVKLEEKFLRNKKSDKREVQHIERAELNKHLAGFICSVRGNWSLWKMVEENLNWGVWLRLKLRNNVFISINNSWVNTVRLHFPWSILYI